MNKNNPNLILQAYLRLLPAQLVIYISGTLSSNINNFVIGNYLDTTSLSVFGMFGPLSNIIYGIALFLSSGSAILCGKALGKNDIEKVKKIFSTSVIICFIFAFLSTALCFIFSKELSLWLTSGNGADICEEYIKTYAISIAFNLIFTLLITYLNLFGNTKTSIVSGLVLTGLIIGFDFVFICGLRLRLYGIGYSQAISYFVVFMIALIRFIFNKKLPRLSFKTIDFKLLPNMLLCGFSSGFAILLYSFRDLILNFYILKMVGQDGIAAKTIAFSVINFTTFLFTQPSAQIVLILSSVFAGEENRTALVKLLKIDYLFVLCGGVICTTVILIFARQFTQLFNAENVDLCVKYLIILAPCVAFVFPGEDMLACYKSLNKPVATNIFNFILCFLSSVIFTLLFINIIGEDTVIYSYIFTALVTLICPFIYSVIKNKRIPKSLEDMLALDKKFGVCEGNRLAISVKTIDEAIGISERVEEFCLERGYSKRISYFSSLAIEEVTTNIIEHGFKKSKNKNNLVVEILITLNNNYINLLIKDNSVEFDPISRANYYNDKDDPCKGIGIKLTMGIAEDVKYKNLFHQNVLMIRLCDQAKACMEA